MNLDNMTIGEFKELSVLFSEKEKKGLKNLGKCIVILQRGWVFVGDLTKTGEEYMLNNSFVVRTWGTTKGLGEIAINGPTKDTKLDETPEVIFHELTVVAIIKCVSEKWL